jgi:OmpA-OmpF porin, OOP family
MRLRGLWFLVLPLVLASPAQAQRLYRLEIGGSGSYFFFDSKTELNGAVGGALRVGYWIYGPLSVEVEGSFSQPKTDPPNQNPVDVKSIGGWALVNVPISRSSTAFLKGGYASVTYGGACPSVSVPGSGPCGSAGALQGGAGVRIALSPTIMMRYDAMVNQSQTFLKFSNIGLYGGISVMVGSKPLVDTDGDKVWDRSDKCPATPPGALVDKHGCATDRDGDGVPDGLDRCPGTEAGAVVNEVGCTIDSDGDRVLDGIDKCPDTPIGATVDQFGCPSDADKDGVVDGVDRCPGTPEGATVDAFGCAGDADNDGVLDGLDKCPYTPPGTPVNSFGCPPGQDSDKDGVPDGLDRCPDTPPNTGVDTNGCPVAPGAAAKAVVPLGRRSFTLPGKVFVIRSAALSPSAAPVLDSVATAMLADTSLTALINGFAQDRLVAADNLRLSQQRADAVRTYILGKGVAARRVTATGRGSQSLLVADTTDAARTTNRRVEIKLQPASPQ